MKRIDIIKKFIIVLIILYIFPVHIFGKEYRVGIGDVLEITILEHDDLKSILTVSPDGTITFPFIGTIKVKDLTLNQIKFKLAKALSPDYVVYPEIYIRLLEAKSQRFFVYGEVKNPGAYGMSDNITVLKAVSIAGGYKKYADVKNVKILRLVSITNGQPIYNEIIINLDKVIKNPQSASDVLIRNGDIIVVPEK